MNHLLSDVMGSLSTLDVDDNGDICHNVLSY